MEHVSSVRPTGKFPEKVENLKRWARFPGWNFRTEFRVPLKPGTINANLLRVRRGQKKKKFKDNMHKLLSRPQVVSTH